MGYILPADIDQSIQSLLATGRYASEEEVLRDALSVLKKRDEDVAAIQAGIDDIQAGRYRSFAECDADFRARHQIAPDA